MSDREIPQWHAVPRPRTVDRSSKVVQLPKRPRRVEDEADPQPRKTWRSERGNVYDPPPTRPVMRSELQAETGAWQAEPTAWQSDVSAAACRPERDGSVVDLDELRRKRADHTPGAGMRRAVKPRRISATVNDRPGDDDRDTDALPTDGHIGRHRK